jgi:hypothetical protein
LSTFGGLVPYHRAVSVELARRLLQWGIAPAEVEGALFDMIEKRVSLMQALARRSPELLDQVERELVSLDLPSIEMVRVSPELAAALPPGLCERLLAVPVHRDPKTGRVDVAAADVFDHHVQSEFGYHLDAPVRLLRARVAALEAALTSLESLSPRGAEPLAKARPRPAQVSLPPNAPLENAERPLPLVRKPGGNPNGTVEPERRFAESVPEAPEPVLSLARPKGPGSRSHPENEALTSEAPAPPVRQGDVEQDLGQVLGALERAVAPDEVLELCVSGLEPMLVVALTLRGSSFEARAGSVELGDPERIRRVRLPTSTASVLETAIRQGYYLGPLPATPVHDGLRELLPPRADEEIYVAPISVSGRASVVLVAARLTQTSVESRRVDEIASAAGAALERIVRNRKRGATT